MAEEKRMNFYRSFYDLTTLLPEDERQKVNTALLDYFFEGIEPSDLSVNGMKVFNGCAGRIAKSRRNAANRAAGYASAAEAAAERSCVERPEAPTKEPTKPATKTPVSYPTKEPTKPATKTPYESGASNAPFSTPTKHAPDRERERDKDREDDEGFIRVEGVSGRAGFSPPTEGQVRGYFSANCLKGDPQEFWDFYAAQGWKRSNGIEIGDWQAQARIWSRKQVELEAAMPRAPSPPADDLSDPEVLERMERELAAMGG